DFAHVVKVLAKGVARPDGKLFEQVVRPEFHLHCMVVRESAVVARADNAQTAVYAAHVCSRSRSDLCCGSAGCERRSVRNEIWKILQQTMTGGRTREGIGVHGLEQVDC